MNSPADRIRSRVSVDAAGCWIWQGSLNTTGYGQLSIRGKLQVTHRVMYEFHHGAVAPGLNLDHLCRNRACCNPAHLEPVTPQINTRRGNAGKHLSDKAMAQTHCLRGHEYTPENTARVNGRRRCRQCHRERHW